MRLFVTFALLLTGLLDIACSPVRAGAAQPKLPPGVLDAIVLIYAERNGKTFVGTGFFCSATGDVVTAYHVIQGATKVEIAGANQLYSRSPRFESYDCPRIAKYDPDWDLAMLKTGLKPRHHLTLAKKIPAMLRAKRAFALGNPDGNKNFDVPVSFPRDKAMLTDDWIGPGGRKVFLPPLVEIIPINLVFDGGMSGGPVIVDNEVIGILSGGRSPGGGDFGWAMPATRLAELRPERTEKRFSDLPPLRLLKSGIEPAYMKSEELLRAVGKKLSHQAVDAKKRLKAAKTAITEFKKILAEPNPNVKQFKEAFERMEAASESAFDTLDVYASGEFRSRVLHPVNDWKKEQLPLIKTEVKRKHQNDIKRITIDAKMYGDQLQKVKNEANQAIARCNERVKAMNRGDEDWRQGKIGRDEVSKLHVMAWEAVVEWMDAEIKFLEVSLTVLQSLEEWDALVDRMIRESSE